MRSSALKLAFAFFLSYGILPSVVAQNDPINIVNTAVPFLRITPDARAGGMGSLGLATEPDPASPFWNMGKPIMETNNTGAVFTFVPKFDILYSETVYLGTFSGYYKFDDKQALTTSLRFFNYGKEDFFNPATGGAINASAGREFGIDVGYSRKLNQRNGLGIALRYINSNLANGVTQSKVNYGKGSAVAADLGWYHDGKNTEGNGFDWGAAISNLGSKFSYSDNNDFKFFIPANLGLGANYTRKFNDRNQISFGVDINKLLVPTPPGQNGTPQQWEDYQDKGVVGSWFSSFGDAPDGFSEELREFQVGIGGEYWYNNQFAFRAGYFFEDKTKGNRKYFTLGAGVKYNMFGLNFSYLVPTGDGKVRNPLSNTMRFSLLFDMDNSKSKSK